MLSGGSAPSTCSNNNPLCNIDPRCVASRDDLNKVVTAYEDGTLTKAGPISVRNSRPRTGAQTLDEVVPGLGKAVDDATAAARQLGVADPAGIQQQLTSAQDGRLAARTGIPPWSAVTQARGLPRRPQPAPSRTIPGAVGSHLQFARRPLRALEASRRVGSRTCP